MPGATARRLALPARPRPWKASMIPHTVPNSPMNGVTVAVVASQFMCRSSLAISSLSPSCSVRSSATRFFTVPRDLIWRVTSSYPKSNTVASGHGRNCSAATATAFKPADFRKARRNRAFEVRARPKVTHFEKMMAQDITEKINSKTRTAVGSGLARLTMSQRLYCISRLAGLKRFNTFLPPRVSIINEPQCFRSAGGGKNNPWRRKRS